GETGVTVDSSCANAGSGCFAGRGGGAAAGGGALRGWGRATTVDSSPSGGGPSLRAVSGASLRPASVRLGRSCSPRRGPVGRAASERRAVPFGSGRGRG